MPPLLLLTERLPALLSRLGHYDFEAAISLAVGDGQVRCWFMVNNADHLDDVTLLEHTPANVSPFSNVVYGTERLAHI